MQMFVWTTWKPWSWAWVVAELVGPLLSLIHTTELSPQVLLRLGHPVLSLAGGRVTSPAPVPLGWLPCIHGSTASSTVLPS